MARKIVFVTSTLVQGGNLGGLAGADATCASLAKAAGLKGTFKAWLSDSMTSAASRLTHADVPYVLTDGTMVARNWADLTDGTIINPISLTENKSPPPKSDELLGMGEMAYTNTATDGSVYGIANDCNGWKNLGGSSHWGSPNQTDKRWTELINSGPACQLQAPIYCFEQ